MKLRILSIGYGRHLFRKDNIEHRRLSLCAKEVGSVDHIVFTDKSDSLTTLVSENNFRLHPTNSKHKIFMIIDAIRIGNKIIKEKEIDVISTQDLFETGLVGWVLKLRHSQLTLQVQEHGDVMNSKHWRNEKFSNQIRYWFATLLLRRVDIIRVVSDRTKVFFEHKFGKNKKIIKLPVIVDTANFVRGANRKEIQKNETFIFVTAARFVPQKNFPLMLRAFAAVYTTNSHIRLRIFGEGQMQNSITEMIEDLNLSEVVEVHGWTTDLAGEMEKADAYILTSNYEGWARVLIEAMLQSLPIVTTDVGCVGEVVKNHEHALVVPVDNLEELTNAMLVICSDQDLYQRLSENLSELDIYKIPGTRTVEYASLWAETLR